MTGIKESVPCNLFLWRAKKNTNNFLLKKKGLSAAVDPHLYVRNYKNPE